MNIDLPKAKEKWKHFKGTIYTVIALARASETQELIVVYKKKSGEGDVWTRPLSEWVELICNRPVPGLGASMNYYGPRFYRA